MNGHGDVFLKVGGKMNNNMVIVIIDSGVDKKHKEFDEEIEEYVFSKEHNAFFVENNLETQVVFGHGTAIYHIVRKIRTFARIINIKLSGLEEGIDEENLCAVLELINEQFHPNIVNLSLGINICMDYKRLYMCCDSLRKNGCIIIAAFDNSGSISYPAAFDNVIGVISGQYCQKINQFEFIEDEMVNIAAKGGLQRLAWSEPEYIMMSGNSFACAHTTVQTALFIKEGYIKLDSILEAFNSISIKRYKFIQNIKTDNNLFTINKAVLFPFNKEMHSLVKYYNLLSFQIIDIYDSKYSSRVKATTSHLLKDDSVLEKVIKNIGNIDWNSFDTLILGHLDELIVLTHQRNLRDILVNEAIKHQKKIISFDVLTNYAEFYSDRIYYPKVIKQEVPPNRFGMMHRLSSPVVGVFGTSSKQGKFTLQLKLRDILIRQGYDIGQIGTEPSALLYGMDYCYPMGYGNSVKISGYDAIRYLNHLMHELCRGNKDLILVGAQSGTITYDMGNISQYNKVQYEFLMGTQPDCVVLCANSYDDLEYIKRTILFIEGCVECKVIAIVLFPMKISKKWIGMYGNKEQMTNLEIDNIKKIWRNTFQIPIFTLGIDDEIEKLVEEITNYFVVDSD